MYTTALPYGYVYIEHSFLSKRTSIYKCLLLAKFSVQRDFSSLRDGQRGLIMDMSVRNINNFLYKFTMKYSLVHLGCTDLYIF